MSAPAPVIVNVPDAYVAVPLSAGLPISVARHGEGRRTTSTFVKVAVARVEVLWLVTASPTYTVDAIEMVSLPSSDQLLPLDDRYAENVEPRRTNLTQYGAVTDPLEEFAVDPPVLTRRWNVSPFPGVTAANTCRDVAVNVSRIMTPALAQEFVFWSVATRATISPSPVSV